MYCLVHIHLNDAGYTVTLPESAAKAALIDNNAADDNISGAV